MENTELEQKEEQKFVYKEKEFIKRLKKPLALHKTSILFQKKYDNFEKEFIGENVQKDINKKLFNQKDLLKSVSTMGEDYTEIGQAFLENEIGMDLIEYLQIKQTAKELFLLDVENTKDLMQIMFENFSEMNYETETDEDLKPTPRAGFMCGWWCYSGFLCPGGNACN